MRRLLAMISLLLAASTGAQAALPARSVFALIVTNNRSSELGRPDLRYADDDGARYYEFFRLLAPAENLFLLTEFDDDSRRLFSQLESVARPPTRAAVKEAVAGIARQVAAASGAETEFYFIFAGHGDVDRGRGFLELRDGAFYSEDVEALLKQIGATRAHVILDSCNSFFVLNPRKPGGRRFATPEDAARSLSARLPNVGVFLSTSAEGEVYEWSELQSGIFSYVVRSGLSGAADANHDGRVSYEELEAFIGTAVASVRNPLYRPTVFARGPGGEKGTALVDLTGRALARLDLDGADTVRLTLRDQDGLPWIDLHKEAGAAVSLRLPARLAAGGWLDELEVLKDQTILRRRRRLEVAEGQAVALAALPESSPAQGARGPADLFRMLFTRPFGPTALAQYQAQAALQPPPVIGVSRDDVERMRLILRQTAEIDRTRRFLTGAFYLSLGAAYIGLGAWELERRSSRAWVAGLSIAAGSLELLAGGSQFFSRSQGEKIYSDFEIGISRPGADPARVVAGTEQSLERLRHSVRTSRIIWGVVGGILVAGGIAGAVLNESLAKDQTDRDIDRIALPGFAILGANFLVSSLFPSALERMHRIWAEDPGIQRVPRPAIGLVKGGATLSLTGRF